MTAQSMTAQSDARQPATMPGRMIRRLGADSAYILLGLPLATISFSVLITGLSLGISLLITLAGVPVLTATLYGARGFASVERRRIAVLDGASGGNGELARRATYRDLPASATTWRRLVAPILDGQYWLDALHGVLVFPIATVTWSIATTWWSVAVAGTTYWAYDWALPHPPDNTHLSELLGFGDSTLARVGLNTAVGVVAVVTLPLVMRACASVQAGLGRTILDTLGQVRERIAGLERDTRAARERTEAAVAAEASALRRLERDIHDGPQQRLVRLAMDLGRAQQQMDADPQAARGSVAEALTQTREALDELRALSRGIAPPVLADRGLAAAITALAGRATVPVELDLARFDDSTRPVPVTENTAYFVAAEALTNVAKHSQASQCWIAVARRGDLLSISVTDDGVGGAQLAKGHGLAGLDDRVRAAGGELTVSSPAGGPTTVSADLPCA